MKLGIDVKDGLEEHIDMLLFFNSPRAASRTKACKISIKCKCRINYRRYTT